MFHMTINNLESDTTPPVGGGRRVLLIGASRGLGLALAQEWLRAGWRVTATVRGQKNPEWHFRGNTESLDPALLGLVESPMPLAFDTLK